jgi:glycosyltransferase 2 family protein
VTPPGPAPASPAPPPGAAAGAGPPRAPGARRPGRRSVARRLTRLALLLLAVLLCAVAGWSQRHQLATALARLDWYSVLLAELAVAVAGGCVLQAWRVLLADLGTTLPLPAAARIFFLSQLGKYVPGSVWPLLAQVDLGREHRVPARRSAAVGVLIIVLSVASGLLAALLTLPLSGAGLAGRYRWAFAAVPPLLAVLHPRILNPLLARGFRLIRRQPPGEPLSLPGVVHAIGWSLLGWLAYGGQVWLLATGLGAGGARLLPLSVGGFALAWVVGLLLVVAPAGAGAREAVLVVVLAPVLNPAAALLIALVSRVLMSVADLLFAGGAVLAERRHRRALSGVPEVARP